jgi:hypothetical protein
MSDMKVYVPSVGRAGTSQSLAWLQSSGRQVVIATHDDEHEAYERAYPWAEILTLSDNCRRHMGLVRQEIMSIEKEPMFFVDDDVHVRLVRFKDYGEMFDMLEQHLRRVPMAGIGKQIFSQGLVAIAKPEGSDKLVVRNKFVSLVYAIDPREFEDCPLENLQVYEDCALIIHAIQRGGTIVTFSATHTNKTPPIGGCNSWRTSEVVLRSLEELCRLYPEYCRKTETRHTAHGHELGVGVRVAWSKVRRAA